MTKRTLTIATRRSPLALWQAHYVQQQLIQHHPDLSVEILGQATAGDKTMRPLTEIGGKDLFVKELQQRLLNQEADIAVHSIKDMAANHYPGLVLGAFCKREDPRDAFVSVRYKTLAELPEGAIVGTSSPRRQCQVNAFNAALTVKPLRGNVNTRLEKLAAREFDAIILAAAGLKRLDLTDKIKQYLPVTPFIPAIGQGAIGIECRADDADTRALLKPIDNQTTRLCVSAERAVNQILGGDCFTPLAAHAQLAENEIQLTGMVGNPDATHLLYSHIKGSAAQAQTLGETLAHDLLKQGAGTLLKNLRK